MVLDEISLEICGLLLKHTPFCNVDRLHRIDNRLEEMSPQSPPSKKEPIRLKKEPIRLPWSQQPRLLSFTLPGSTGGYFWPQTLTLGFISNIPARLRAG